MVRFVERESSELHCERDAKLPVSEKPSSRAEDRSPSA